MLAAVWTAVTIGLISISIQTWETDFVVSAAYGTKYDAIRFSRGQIFLMRMEQSDSKASISANWMPSKLIHTWQLCDQKGYFFIVRPDGGSFGAKTGTADVFLIERFETPLPVVLPTSRPDILLAMPMPLHPFEVVWFPQWLLLTGSMLAGALGAGPLIYKVRRARRRRDRGLCVQCGYDLRGSSELCPECGKAFGFKPAG